MVPKCAVSFKSIFSVYFTHIELSFLNHPSWCCLFYTREHLVTCCLTSLPCGLAYMKEKERERCIIQSILRRLREFTQRIFPMGWARKSKQNGGNLGVSLRLGVVNLEIDLWRLECFQLQNQAKCGRDRKICKYVQVQTNLHCLSKKDQCCK